MEETDESREIKRQFKKREIIISVFGRHNCGKSTLLNAILNIRYNNIHIQTYKSIILFCVEITYLLNYKYINNYISMFPTSY